MSESKKILSDTVRAKIDHWLLRYPPDQKRSGVMQALHIVQEENNGWISPELIEAVAAYLELPVIAVEEVATFYSMYNLKPLGRHVIHVCTNISCMLRGSEEVMKQLKNRLKIEVNETTSDGKFTLKEAECLAACTRAPMFQINKKYYEELDSKKIDAILNALEPEHGQ